jgi:hypothetical protein
LLNSNGVSGDSLVNGVCIKECPLQNGTEIEFYPTTWSEEQAKYAGQNTTTLTFATDEFLHYCIVVEEGKSVE